MAVHSAKGSYTKASPHVTQVSTFPAPVRGVDNRIPLSSNDDSVCIYTFNMVPSSYGMEVRKGYREWQTGLDEGTSTGIGTIIPFEGNTEGPNEDRLFAVTNEGIWDVTISGAAPILKATFPNISVEAGFGSFAHYIDDADEDFLYYADNVNGLYQYTQSTDTWEIATEITGVTIPLINFVVVHKQRIWFCEQNSTLGWYLGIGARKGVAESFNFGGKFKHGGALVGLYNWSIADGGGLDDILVAVSSSGDVLPYKGSDPSIGEGTSGLDPWKLIGTYFIGSMANGSRCASQYGNNLSFLSSYGIIEMSDLLNGVGPRMDEVDSIGARIADFIRRDMLEYRNDNGWDIKQLAPVGAMVITSPPRKNGEIIQYVYSHDVRGWGFWRDVPVLSIDVWEDHVYFGTADNRVCVMDVVKDNVKLIPPGPPSLNGLDINWSILTSYQDFGTPAIFKRGKLIRPNFLSTSDVAFNAKFLYDYDIQELIIGAVSPNERLNEWDVSIWDIAVWGSNELSVYDKIVGGSGLGRYVAVGIKGSSISGTRLLSVDVFWDSGGGL